MGNVSSDWGSLLAKQAKPANWVKPGQTTEQRKEAFGRRKSSSGLEAPPQEPPAPPAISLSDPVARFDNLSGKDIEALWRTFVVQQDSFAVSKTDLIKIMSVIKDSIGGSDPTQAYEECAKATENLFKHWVKHVNPEVTQSSVVDIMEVIMALLFTSRMPMEDKINFLFDCMDFDGDDDLDFEELAISIKSVEGGLAKLRGGVPSSHQKILELVREWFPAAAASLTYKVSRQHFTDFCTKQDGVPYRIFQLYAEAEGETSLELEQDLALRGKAERVIDGGDEFTAIKPWLGTVKNSVPTPYLKKTPDSSAPSSFLLLDWIHGYTVDGAYNNVRYVPGQEGESIVYNAAAVGVVMSRDYADDGTVERRQSFFLEHTDDVISLAVGTLPGPDGSPMGVVATGELGPKPKIEVWCPPADAYEGQNPRPLFSFDGLHSRGVCCLAFSCDYAAAPSGAKKAAGGPTYLVSVGLDDDHSVGVYSLDTSGQNKAGRLVGSAKGNKQRVLCAQWNPYASRQAGGKDKDKEGVTHFVTCGIKCVDLWTLHPETSKLTSRKAVFKSFKVVTFLSVAFVPESGDAVVGTSVGSLYALRGREVVKEIASDKAGAGNNNSGSLAFVGHDGAVLSMCNHPSSGYILSAGKDGRVLIWATAKGDLVKLASLDVMGLPGMVKAGGEVGVRSVQLREDRRALLLGTSNGGVYEVLLQNALPSAAPAGGGGNGLALNVTRSVALAHAHFKGEVWGLAVYPAADKARLYASVGDDSTLRLWDLRSRQLVHVRPLAGPSRCCAWSPDGTLLALGYGVGSKGKNRLKVEGVLEVLEFDLSKLSAKGQDPFTSKHVAKDAKEWFSEVRFSPDGKTLAAGSHDNNIYLYSVYQTFKRRAKFGKHTSYITHLDFSADSRFMQSTCGSYELLFSNAQNGQHLTDAKEMRDVAWASWTCILGWPVQGIWPPCADGTDINAVDRSPDGSVLATGDDFGRVRLFRYPVGAKQADSNVSIGHSSHVSCVRWAAPPSNATSENRRATAGESEFLISTGGNDKCVFQWRHHRSPADNNSSSSSNARRAGSGEAALGNATSAEDESLLPKAKAPRPGAEVQSNDPDELVALNDVVGGGDEFGASKPWAGNIFAPSAPKKGDEQSLKYELNSQLVDLLKRQAVLRTEGVGDKGKEFREKLRLDGARVNDLVCKVLRGESNRPPDDDGLTLEWVHGYRSDDCRNNVRYAATGELVYHAAAVSVVMDTKGPKQRFCHVHSDDIVSMAMHPEGQIVATGQLGRQPKIQVWEVGTRRVLSTLQGTLDKGISLINFGPQGDLLLAVGQDDEHSIALYEWRSGTLRGVCKGGRDDVLALDFLPTTTSGGDFISCGVRHVKLWTRQGQNLAARTLRLPAEQPTAAGGKAATPAFTTIAWLGEDAVIGSNSGHVYLVPLKAGGGKEKELRMPAPVSVRGASQPAHDGAVFASSNTRDRTRVLTGGKDGRVIAWAGGKAGDKGAKAGGMNVLWVLDLSCESPSTTGWEAGVAVMGLRSLDFTSARAAIRSVQASEREDGRVVIGTHGSEIVEVKVDKGRVTLLHNGPLVAGHYKDEVWGLATHPTEREYITVGDDHTLRKWDIARRRMVGCLDVGGMARACAYSPDGQLIAVGMGGSVGRGRQRVDGAVKLIDNSPKRLMTEVYKASDAKEWISQVKFTPDGKTLAAGSHDNNIYLYSVTERKLTLRFKFAKNTSYITHFDFSADSHYMQSNSGSYELLISNVQNGAMQRAGEMCNVAWASCTCVIGWPVQGIWPPCSDGTDVNAVDRSHVGTLLATADDFGKVKLFRYPCVQKDAQALEFLGHSAHVTNVRWTALDECLISTGGGDKCVFQWANCVTDSGAYSVAADEQDGEGLGLAGTGKGKEEGVRRVEDPEVVAEAQITLDFEAGPVQEGGGDEFMAVKPWLGSIKAPSKVEGEADLGQASSLTRAPKTEVQLEWVYGYAGHTYPNNLFYSAGGDVIYPAAAVGVVLRVDRREGQRDGSGAEGKQASQQGTVRFNAEVSAPSEVLCHKQRFYRGHEKDIAAVAMCPQRRFVATGDLVKVGRQPSIHVWDSSSCAHVATLPPFHKRGVCALSFNHACASASDGGEALLASVGLDDDHTVAVWKDVGGAWSKPTRLAVGKGDNNPVTFAAWARVPAKEKKGEGDDTYPLVTGGVRHIRFWKIEGTSLTAKKGVFGKVTPPTALLCGTSHCVNGEWRLITGASTGEMLVWNGRECIQARPAHERALQCMVSVGGEREDMARLITGGREGKVKVWNWSLESIMEYDVSSFRHVIEPSLRAVDGLSRPTTQAAKQLNVARILVGTGGGEVFEIPTDQRQFDAALPPLAQSHFSEEAWGLDAPLSSVAALRDLVVTSGDDGTVRIWDTEQHAMVGRYLLPKRRGAASGATGAGAASASPTRPAKGRAAAKPAAKTGAAEGPEEGGSEGATTRAAASAERQMSRAVAWEPSLGQYILVGLGGDVGRSKNTRVGGHLVIHVARDKSGRWEVRDRYRQPFPMYVSRLECEWVSDVKWCPRTPTDVEEGDGRVFLRYATGSHDNLIRIFGVWSLPAADEGLSSMLLDPSEADKPAPPPQYLMRLQGNTSYVTHLDFSLWHDGKQYVQSNSGGYELLFWDVTQTKPPLPTDEGAKAEEAGVSLAPRATPTATRNATWGSWTCVLGWPVQGIFSGTMDGTDVNAVCRVDQTKDQSSRLALAGDDGKLKVYKYPCLATNAEFAEGCAHSSHVTNVKFTAAREGRDTRLFTTGGRDKCVMQWKLMSS